VDLTKDRRVLAIGGAAVAAAALVVVIGIAALRANDDAPPAEASGPGLVVQSSGQAAQKLDPADLLKCYVNGKLVGEMRVADCAAKNGVATGPLEVGVEKAPDDAPANAVQAVIAPPPPPPIDVSAQDPSGADAAEADGRPCWSREGGAWSRAPGGMDMDACVQFLFAGQCLRPGGVVYGMWGDRTLRLAGGRVEMAGAGGAFHALPDQPALCGAPQPE
jgi:hypothetical protein